MLQRLAPRPPSALRTFFTPGAFACRRHTQPVIRNAMASAPPAQRPKTEHTTIGTHK